MKSWHSIALGSLLWFGSGPARAEKIEIAYSWSLSRQAIPAPGGNQIVPVYQARGTIFAPVDSAVTTGIPGINWNASSPPGTWPAGDFNATVRAKVVLTDVASGHSMQFNYQVAFALTGRGAFPYLEVSDSPIDPPGPLRWGNRTYQFYPYSYASPAGQGSSGSRTLPVSSGVDSFTVAGIVPTVTVSRAPGVPTPEPSTLALGGIAALGLAVGRWRRGRAWARGFLASP